MLTLFFILPLIGAFLKLLSTAAPFCWPLLSYFLESPAEIILCCFVPLITYHNADTDKIQILSDLKDKAGIYMWTHIETGKFYIGSSFNISERMYNYFSIKHLERRKTVYICNAIRLYGYSAFSFSILEFIDITGLSKKESRILILEREQFYLDFFSRWA